MAYVISPDLFGTQGFRTQKIKPSKIGVLIFRLAFKYKPALLFFRNLRYAAYRSIFLWLNPGPNRKPGRYPIASCVVNKVKELYPSPTYRGFQPRSPVFKRKKRN